MAYASKLLAGQDVQVTWPGITGQCDRDQVRFFLDETAKIGEPFIFSHCSQHEGSLGAALLRAC